MYWVVKQLGRPLRFDASLRVCAISLLWELRSFVLSNVSYSYIPNIVLIGNIVYQITHVLFFFVRFIRVLRHLEFWWNLREWWRIRFLECSICSRGVFICWHSRSCSYLKSRGNIVIVAVCLILIAELLLVALLSLVETHR
jgi:hypothetical protein